MSRPCKSKLFPSFARLESACESPRSTTHTLGDDSDSEPQADALRLSEELELCQAEVVQLRKQLRHSRAECAELRYALQQVQAASSQTDALQQSQHRVAALSEAVDRQ